MFYSHWLAYPLFWDLFKLCFGILLFADWCCIDFYEHHFSSLVFQFLFICFLSVLGWGIEDLEYTPKLEFEGNFKVENVPNEVYLPFTVYPKTIILKTSIDPLEVCYVFQTELLRLWFNHMQEFNPGIYVTYNGDFFDWPFVKQQAKHHGMKMSDVC